MAALEASRNRQASTTDLAYRLKTSRLAVVSGMRALQRAGRVVAFRNGRDQWAALTWGVRHG